MARCIERARADVRVKSYRNAFTFIKVTEKIFAKKQSFDSHAFITIDTDLRHRIDSKSNHHLERIIRRGHWTISM